MLTTLIRKELLENLMTFRFCVTVFIMPLLVVANTSVLVKDYERRLASYNTAVKLHQEQLQGAKTYSAGLLYVARPPNPLSIFNVGLDKRLGNQIRVYHGYVPTLWDASTAGAENPFLNIFTSIDISFIFEVILSLLALIFAYDALTGERERGTLRLVLVYPVNRGILLLAKYISAMFCLLVPMLLSMILALIVLTTAGSFSLSTDDFLRIGGIILTSLVYLSVFYLIGMLISTMTRRTSSALMLSIFLWFFMVLVYPNLILAVMYPSFPQARATSAYNEIKQIWEKFDRERHQFLATDALPGETWSFGIIGRSAGEDFDDDPIVLSCYTGSYIHFWELSEEFEPRVPHARSYFRFAERRVIDATEKTWQVRKQRLTEIFVRPAEINRTLRKFSPVGMYDAAMQSWAGTGILGIQDFFRAVRQYQQTVINHFYDKKIFGSRQWFLADQGSVDWGPLPMFSFFRSDVSVSAKRAFPEFCLLVLINLGLFLLIFLVFQRSEV